MPPRMKLRPCSAFSLVPEDTLPTEPPPRPLTQYFMRFFGVKALLPASLPFILGRLELTWAGLTPVPTQQVGGRVGRGLRSLNRSRMWGGPRRAETFTGSTPTPPTQPSLAPHSDAGGLTNSVDSHLCRKRSPGLGGQESSLGLLR